MGEVFVTGYAKFPKNITGSEIYNEVGVGLILNKESGKIMDADCTLVTRTGRDFISKLLIEENISEMDSIIKNIENYYFGQAQKAIIAALKSAQNQYYNKNVY